MQLYINCPTCNKKIILDSQAKTRQELALNWGGWEFVINCPHCVTGLRFHVSHVGAEPKITNAAPGAIIGGLIGLLIGPEGALIGSALGGAIGLGTDETERKMVRDFNNS